MSPAFTPLSLQSCLGEVCEHGCEGSFANGVGVPPVSVVAANGGEFANGLQEPPARLTPTGRQYIKSSQIMRVFFSR